MIVFFVAYYMDFLNKNDEDYRNICHDGNSFDWFDEKDDWSSLSQGPGRCIESWPLLFPSPQSNIVAVILGSKMRLFVIDVASVDCP
mmetsp:Transcript_25740/g.54395  ORF Transcript_25740/g.54395 Transcript_25740/m.54395 type:complete len:87 (+) Transcript_25740:710-970(+)